MMFRKSVKSLLVAVFGFFLIAVAHPVSAQDQHTAPEEKAEAFNPTKEILGHIQDGYEFHFISIGDLDLAIHLPIMVYSPERGISVFSSSRFGHDGLEEYDGYRLENGNTVVSVTGEKIYDFSLTRNVVQMLLAMTLFVILMLNVAKKYKKGIGVTSAPNGFQGLIEPVILFVREDIAKPNLGNKWQKYMPFLLTVFFFILFNTIVALIPGSANVTGNIAFTAMLGVIALIVILFSTTKHFWAHIFWPPGVPFLVKFILIPVELAGVLLIKPGALIIRLFANMVAGHIIILSFISLIFILGGMTPVAGWAFSPVSVLFTVFIYFIEIIVAFVQAFIFTVLTAVFIGQGFEGSDHDVHPGTVESGLL